MIPFNEIILSVGGLARDCEYNLKQNLERVESMRLHFKQLNIFILENDSRDSTVAVMKDFAETHENIYIETFKEKKFDISDTTGKSQSRICRLTSYRNRLLEMMLEKSSANYIAMIDWDLDGFDPMGVLRSIEHAPDNWGALFANGRNICFYKSPSLLSFVDTNKLYDPFAILEDGRMMDDITKEELMGFCQMKKTLALGSELKHNKYVKCTSSFSGIGIYKREAIKGCRYATKEVGGKYICEHIGLNSQIVKLGYNNYVSSYLTAYVEITQNTILGFLLHRFFPSIYDKALLLHYKRKSQMLGI